MVTKKKLPNKIKLDRVLEKKEELIDALIVLQSYATQEKENLIGELNILEDELLLATFKQKFFLEFIYANGFKMQDLYEFINEAKVDPETSLIKKEILEYIKDLDNQENSEEEQ